MNRWVKITAAAIAVMAVLALAAAAVGGWMGERKMARTIKVDVAPIVLHSGRAHVEQGRYLFATRGCADCHGAAGAGEEVIRSGAMLIVSPNITGGANSATAAYTALDWVRTLRHGVKPNGTPVMIMPSEDYNRLTDDDVSAIIAYVRELPPVPGQRTVIKLPTAVKVMYAAGIVRDAAEKIDHALPPSIPVPSGVTVAHGAYVANSCIGCHGPQLRGGKIPGAPPLWPAAADLTPGGSVMARYPTPEKFMEMMRSGRRPDGSAISSVMPFGSLREMTDVDVAALHAYLHTLPPPEAGQR